MDLELLVRLALIVLGIFFIILSAAGGILELARRAGGLESANPLGSVTKLLEALQALFTALAAAPTAAIVLIQGNPFQAPTDVTPAPIEAAVADMSECSGQATAFRPAAPC